MARSQYDVFRARVLQIIGEELNRELDALTSERDRTLYTLARRKGSVQMARHLRDVLAEAFKNPLDIYDKEGS